MKISTKLLLAGAAFAPIVGLSGVSLAQAATNTDTNWRDSFAQSFATKFNVNKDDVTKFMDERRTIKQAEMKQKMSDALKAGGFSDSQITALADKKQSDREAMKAWRDANPNATRAEMKAQHDKLEADFSQWAKDQGIDLTKVQAALKSADIGRGGKRGGMRHDGGMHDNGAPLE